jgi:hypothetical protein
LEDHEALEQFKKRLRNYLGDDLVDRRSELVHASEDGDPDPDSPWLNLRIGVTPGDKPTLILFKCSLLQ